MAHLRHDFNQKTHWNNQLFFTNQNDSLSSSLSSIRRKTWRCNLLKSFFIWKNFISYFFLFSLLFGEEEGRDEEAKARVCADTHISWWMVLTLNTWIDQRCVSLKICFKKKKRRKKGNFPLVGVSIKKRSVLVASARNVTAHILCLTRISFIRATLLVSAFIFILGRLMSHLIQFRLIACHYANDMQMTCKWHANEWCNWNETCNTFRNQWILKIGFYSWILIFFNFLKIWKIWKNRENCGKFYFFWLRVFRQILPNF